MKISFGGHCTGPLSFLLLALRIWLSVTLVSVVLVGCAVVPVVAALVNLPMALWRRVRA